MVSAKKIDIINFIMRRGRNLIKLLKTFKCAQPSGSAREIERNLKRAKLEESMTIYEWFVYVFILKWDFIESY